MGRSRESFEITILFSQWCGPSLLWLGQGAGYLEGLLSLCWWGAVALVSSIILQGHRAEPGSEGEPQSLPKELMSQATGPGAHALRPGMILVLCSVSFWRPSSRAMGSRGGGGDRQSG